MIYVTASLHGCYENYEAILKRINLKDSDMLFVLGNTVDGGEKGIEILTDMMMRGNVYPILGDHDMVAYEILSQIEKETRNDITAPLSNDLAKRCDEWRKRGGEGTMNGFFKLSDDDKTALLEYMEEGTLYEEIECNGIDFVLCYTMPDGFCVGDSLESYEAEDILSGNIDYEKEYSPGKLLVTGKDITLEIDRSTHGKIFKNDYHVAVNCGGYMGGASAVYCLDTGEEIYVE